MRYDDEAPWFPWTDEDLARLVDGATVVAHLGAKSTERITVNSKAGVPTFDRLHGVGAKQLECMVSTRQCDPTTIVPPPPAPAKASESIAQLHGGTKLERLAHARDTALKARHAVGLGESYLGQAHRAPSVEEALPLERKPRPKRLADVLTAAAQLCMAELVQVGGWKRADVERAVDRLYRDADDRLVDMPEQLAIDLLRAASSAAKHLGEPLDRMAARATGLLRR